MPSHVWRCAILNMRRHKCSVSTILIVFMTQEDFFAPQKGIFFEIEENSTDFSLDEPTEERLTHWIEQTIQQEGKELGYINYVFCDDDYLHQINMEYLQHDTLTDIITFPYNYSPIESDIFISIERVKDNAQDFGVSFQTELNRVIIHGVFHLCGYLDETDEEEAAMREKENQALQILK